MSRTPGRAGAKPCGRASCPICLLRRRLTGQGATPNTGATLREPGCTLDLRFCPGSRCGFRLRLDVPTADYRRRHGAGRMSKMCDFAAAAVRGDELLLAVVEIKKGAADRESVEQLQAGLDLLRRNLPAGPLPKLPAAHLVVGKLESQLKHIVRARSAILRFGEIRIRPQVHSCGDRMQM